MNKVIIIAAVIILATFACYQFRPSKEQRDNAAFISLLKVKGLWIFQHKDLGDNCFIAPRSLYDKEISALIDRYNMEQITSYEPTGECITRLYGSMDATETIK
jgi:hypothetical protein